LHFARSLINICSKIITRLASILIINHDRSYKNIRHNFNEPGKISAQRYVRRKKGIKEWITYSTEDVSNYVNWVSYGLLSLGYKKGDKLPLSAGTNLNGTLLTLALHRSGSYMFPFIQLSVQRSMNIYFEHSDVSAIILSNKTIYNKVKPITNKIHGLKKNLFI